MSLGSMTQLEWLQVAVQLQHIAQDLALRDSDRQAAREDAPQVASHDRARKRKAGVEGQEASQHSKDSQAQLAEQAAKAETVGLSHSKKRKDGGKAAQAPARTGRQHKESTAGVAVARGVQKRKGRGKVRRGEKAREAALHAQVKAVVHEQ